MTYKQQYVTVKLTSQQAYFIANTLDECLEDDINHHRIAPEAEAFSKRTSQKLRRAMAEQLNS